MSVGGANNLALRGVIMLGMGHTTFAGQDWKQLGELALALVLCSLIGLERELRQKSAGLRTHTQVGVAAAVFMLISKYGFDSVLGVHVTLDPSRVAAQIVSGIGFIGGGIIFVQGGSVRGLTTAATLWLTAGVGMACGGGLPVLAVEATVVNFIVTIVFPRIVRGLPRRIQPGPPPASPEE